jgi:5-oxoprolinase (ATP-hydrolysing) subunit A
VRVSDLVGAKKVDLNVDIGEGFPFDEELLKFATSANICCGVHAGSIELTKKTIALCRRKKVRFGAHPGYPDRENMGRTPLQRGQERVYLQSIFDQVMDFAQIARAEYIKPHGAFYNDTAILLSEGWDNPEEGQSRYEAGGIHLSNIPGLSSLSMLLRVHKLPLMGLAPTAHAVIAARAGQALIKEGFADRRYLPDGTLMPRTEAGAVLTDPAMVKEQVLLLAPVVDSICLHGDTEGCLEFAELVYKTLRDGGFEVGF